MNFLGRPLLNAYMTGFYPQYVTFSTAYLNPHDSQPFEYYHLLIILPSLLTLKFAKGFNRIHQRFKLTTNNVRRLPVIDGLYNALSRLLPIQLMRFRLASLASLLCSHPPWPPSFRILCSFMETPIHAKPSEKH